MSISRVLIVDDSTAVCLFMANALQKAGYQTYTAEDGRHGLSLVSTLRPHCLITDVILPGINGYTICRRVRTMDPHHTLPIILVSIKDSPFDTSYGLSMGADRYLAKPFTEETLVRTVWDVLPAHSRPVTSPLPPPGHTDRARLEDLIPRLRENASLLATNNPFAYTWQMDRPTRQLMGRIDGYKTVSALLQTSGLDVQRIIALLKILYEKELIEFCDRQGHLLTEIPFDSF